jgi:hypothetical protein
MAAPEDDPQQPGIFFDGAGKTWKNGRRGTIFFGNYWNHWTSHCDADPSAIIRETAFPEARPEV